MGGGGFNTRQIIVNKGFTLSEVLITLGIIGIIAAFTIPGVITKYQKKIVEENLKASYQMFFTAINLALADNGNQIPIDKEFFEDTNFLNKYINPYLNAVKQYNGKHIKISIPNKESESIIAYNKNWFCINSGICYTQIYSGGVNQDNGYTWLNYIYIIVDINGTKKPNRVGRDVFYFNVNLNIDGKAKTNKKPMLSGFVYNLNSNAEREKMKYQCSSNSAGWSSGSGCTALIMNDNWKILDDYPW